MLIFVPPSVITTFCMLTICYFYGCMYQHSVALKCNNHRAKRTVGFSLLMFLLQLTLTVSFVILVASVDSRKPPSCNKNGFIVTPPPIVLPPGIIAAFLLVRNPQIKRRFSVFLSCSATAQVEVLEQIRMANEAEEETCY